MKSKFLSFNELYREHKRAFWFQSIVAILITLGVVFTLGGVTSSTILSAIGASSLAASTFIAFGLPDSPVAKAQRMIGSYVIGILVGVFFYWISNDTYAWTHWMTVITHKEICSGLAVGLTMLIMFLLDLEHPPAAGLSLGIVIDEWNWWVLIVVLLSIVIIALLRVLMRPWLHMLMGN